MYTYQITMMSSEQIKSVALIHEKQYTQYDLEDMVKYFAPKLMEENGAQYMLVIWEELIQALVKYKGFKEAEGVYEAEIVFDEFAGSNLIKAE